MGELITWKCSECGQVLQGIINDSGEFISDWELNKLPEYPKRGCTCGCLVGMVIEEAMTSDE